MNEGEEDQPSIMLTGDTVEKVSQSCYLCDMLSCGGGVEAAVTTRVRCGWKKFKSAAGVLLWEKLVTDDESSV